MENLIYPTEQVSADKSLMNNFAQEFYNGKCIWQVDL